MIKFKDTRIVISAEACFNERRAAAFLAKYIRIVTGHVAPIVYDTEPAQPCEIIVGKTSREEGLDIQRSRDGVWQYVTFEKNGSLFLTGLGVGSDPFTPYVGAYKHLDDGHVGTVIAAYHLVYTLLKCDFLNEAYVEFPVNPEAFIPDGYEFNYTRERLLSQLPENTEGPLLCSLPIGYATDWNMSGTIIKTKNGKFILIDGGRPEDAEHFVNVLMKLSNGKKPVVAAWLFTHLHVDHFGTMVKILQTPEYRDNIKVENFYHHILPLEFYTEISNEKANQKVINAHEVLTHMDEYMEGCKVHELQRGDIIDVDGISFECLRVADMKDGPLMNFNDSSTVFRMTVEGQKWLLLGDAECVSSNDLMNYSKDKLKADVVQVGHHGCGNVSKEVYKEIGAVKSIWQTGPRFLFSECGEGLNTHNTGVIRTRVWLRELGMKPENDIIIMDGLFETKLPMKL